MTTDTTLDLDARYRVAGYPGVAFWLKGWATSEHYEGDILLCTDEDCDHGLSDLCWAEGDFSLSIDTERVIAVMVGDDREHIIDVTDLTPLAEGDSCGSCGQIGCTADGREG